MPPRPLMPECASPPPQLRCASFTSIFYLGSLLLFMAFMPFVDQSNQNEVRLGCALMAIIRMS